MQISQSAFDLIVAEEVTSKAYYIKHYQRPEWPGGASGVTVGIGYDLGYATKAKIAADFGPHVSPQMLSVMQSCAGVKGGAAQALLGRVKGSIIIPWDLAINVFANRDVPQWIAEVNRVVPNCDILNPTCLGVLVSLAYNRGAGGFISGGDRNVEMRAIRAAMAAKNPAGIPDQLRSMARIWPNLKGLQGRRRREADLFAKGLTYGKNDPTPVAGAVVVAPPKATEINTAVITVTNPDASVRTPVSTTSTAQNTTTAVIAGAGAGGAGKAYQSGVIEGTTAILAIIFIAVVAGGIWFAWYRNRNPK
jgi:hypothetical protein